MCMAEDADHCKASTTTQRKARKQHKCSECRRTIAPGERYEHTSGIDGEGDPFRHKVCQHCQVATAWLVANCGGWVMTMVAEDLFEHAGEYNRPDLGEMARNVMTKWEGKPVPELPRELRLGDARVG